MNIVAAAVCFLISWLFPVICSYLNSWSLVPPIGGRRGSGSTVLESTIPEPSHLPILFPRNFSASSLIPLPSPFPSAPLCHLTEWWFFPAVTPKKDWEIEQGNALICVNSQDQIPRNILARGTDGVVTTKCLVNC